MVKPTVRTVVCTVQMVKRVHGRLYTPWRLKHSKRYTRREHIDGGTYNRSEHIHCSTYEPREYIHGGNIHTSVT